MSIAFLIEVLPNSIKPKFLHLLRKTMLQTPKLKILQKYQNKKYLKTINIHIKQRNKK